jgi:uncharacterized protein (DUF433 family)
MSPRNEPVHSGRRSRAVDQQFDDQCADWGLVATYAVCHGEPRFNTRHIRVRDVTERFLAGDSVALLASDFALDVQQVEDALRFALAKDGIRTAWRDRQLAKSAREGT